jgi:predicted ATPase/DNA-binding winged helix-turn-helix (wHTH) protein
MAMQSRYRFAHFELLGTERRLLVDGHDAPLGARAFDLLVALVEQRDRTVGKDELIDLVWPGLVVEGNNLQVQISSLRKILGPRAISTIPGRGYRFALEVSDLTSSDTGADEAADRASIVYPSPPGTGSSRPLQGNLPAVLPELIGRAGDVASLLTAIGAHRLVSVVGAAGIGKTRLAQAAAHALRREFEDGVWMVELAPVADPALLPTAVAQALGVTLPGKRSSQDEVIDALRDRAALLVLDNCEHLLDAASAFAHALRRRAPEAHLLITSQELLRIADEHLYHATTLSVPVTPDLMAARVSGAVALLVNRVQALRPSFVLTEQNCADVVDICRRLDGLPLAIELAAARVPLLGTAGVRERLDERFRMLTGGVRTAMRRHQTLREALDWSHSLLDGNERAVFRRAGVFAGTFSMSAAQQVLGDEQLDSWEVLEHLGALVDKSLVIAELSEPPRYRLLESARAYALEKLRDAGETDATRERHAQAVLAIFEAGLQQQWLVPRSMLVEQHLPDLDNLRAALEWGRFTTGAQHIALAGASMWMWTGIQQRVEALRICERAMARIDESTPPALEARLLSEWCVLPSSPPVPAERAAAERAVALFRNLDDRRSAYIALERLQINAQRCGDVASCERVSLEMAQLHDANWPPASRWHLLMARAVYLSRSNQTEAARVAFEECLQLARAVRESRHIHASLQWLIDIASETRHSEEAVTLCRELVVLTRADRFTSGLAVALCMLSEALAKLDHIDEALTTAREATPLHAQQGTPLWVWLVPFAQIALKQGRVSDSALALGRVEAKYGGFSNNQRDRDDLRSLLRQSLSSDELQSLLAEGAALTDEEAARIALSS